MTECEEVASALYDSAPAFASFDEAARWVRKQLHDETAQVVDDVAEALFRAQRRA